MRRRDSASDRPGACAVQNYTGVGECVRRCEQQECVQGRMNESGGKSDHHQAALPFLTLVAPPALNALTSKILAAAASHPSSPRSHP